MPADPADNAPTAQLGEVFDELIDLVGETKQALWAVPSPERHEALDSLRTFLREQIAAVDDAEQRLGGRPPWIRNPSGHEVRNLAAQAGSDPDRLLDLLVADLTTVDEDVRRRSASAEGDWREVLSDLAAGLEGQIDALRKA
jgi:DNA-binding ferritin-like protein